MNEMLILKILREVSRWVGILGVLTGLDLLFGAKVVSILNKLLTTVEVFSIDKAIVNVKARIFLGVLFLLISVLMIVLVVKTPV